MKKSWTHDTEKGIEKLMAGSPNFFSFLSSDRNPFKLLTAWSAAPGLYSLQDILFGKTAATIYISHVLIIHDQKICSFED